MTWNTSPIKRTRMTVSGYSKPRYVCADCGQSTAATLAVYRNGQFAFVHRASAGCHRGVEAHDIRSGQCHNVTARTD